MSGINSVTVVGRLGRDPEGRTVRDAQIVNMTIATSEKWRDKNTGEQKEVTEWHRVVIFNERLAGIAIQYLKKGDICGVQGKLKTRKWQDQSGNDRYSTEIVVDRFNGDLHLLGGGDQSSGQRGGGYDQSPTQNTGADLDDDVPF